MTTSNQSPELILRDGALKITIWKNEGEKGAFYTASPAKTYEKDDELHDGHSFVASDLLRLAELAREAHAKIRKLRDQEPKPARGITAKQAQRNAAAPAPS